jgi:hypothetical protein
VQKTTCNSLIKPLPSGKKIKLGTLKTSGARFLEVPNKIGRAKNKQSEVFSGFLN